MDIPAAPRLYPECPGCLGTNMPLLLSTGTCGDCAELDAYVDEHGPLWSGFPPQEKESADA